jgi:NAD(P)-dependent dehydrogenase (short-subunit alcohol dehydrogenase family)
MRKPAISTATRRGTVAPRGWTVENMPDLDGRVAVVTGANSGIGRETALALARRHAHVVLACRSATRAEEALDDLARRVPGATMEVLIVDLADERSFEAAADAFVARHDRLDLLINNAAVMAVPLTRTASGRELQLATNHLGHFALTGRLLGLLLQTPGSRVVSVTSIAHRVGRIDFDDLDAERSYGRWRRYAQSKLANLLFAQELQRRLEGAGQKTAAVAAHPGVSRTNLGKTGARGFMARVEATGRPLWDRVVSQPAAAGALPVLRATVDENLRGVECFGPGGVLQARGLPRPVGVAPGARRADVARRLWHASEVLTGVRYSFG